MELADWTVIVGAALHITGVFALVAAIADGLSGDATVARRGNEELVTRVTMPRQALRIPGAMAACLVIAIGVAMLAVGVVVRT